MASGLSIVIDTRNAELNIKNLNQALERLENQGNSIANMMRNLGSNNPFAALTASINITKSDFNALAASANMVKTTTKEMGDALVYAKTTLTGAATAATTFQAAMRGIGNSLNTAQAAMARFNQSGQSIATVLNSMNGANGSNGVNNLNNAIKQLNPNIAALNNETKAVNASLRTFSSTAIAAETASNAFNDSVKKVYTSADILTKKIGALNGGFTVLSQKADVASSALSRFAQNATTTGSSMGGLISQSHTLAQNMANMGSASNTGANNTGTALARVNGALSNTQAQMNGFNNTAHNTQNTFNQFNANIHNTQNNFTQLNNNVNLTRNSLTALSSVVTNNTTVINNYNQSLNHASASAGHANGAFEQLNRTLSRLQALATGGIMGGMLLSVAKTADAMQGLENQVRLVTQGEEQREEVQRRLLVIANKNYSDIEAVTGSYQRNAFALAQLGKSQMDVLNFTDALSLAMRTGGRSMLEQKSAVYQLSQAMGAGKLQGDEYKSIAENAPVLLSYIAKEMGVAQGALKELSSEGKITSEIIYNAMMKARPEMEKMAQSLPITMSQAWQQVNNSYKTFVDNFMNGTDGMSQGIASMLQGIGKNFDTVIKGMTIAGGLAFVGLASKIDIATKSMALFNFVANANPFVRMATIILAVSSAFYGLNDVINTTSVIMGDLIHMITDGWTGIFNLIGDGLNSLQGVVAQNNDDIGKSYKDMFTNATTDHDKFIANATFASNNLVKTISTDNMKNEQSYFGFYSRTQKGFLGFVEFVGTAVIAAVSTLGGFFKFIFNGIEDTLKRMGNALMTAEEWIQKKLGNNVQHKRYDTFNNLSADQSYADVNSAGQKWWQDNFIMPLSGQVRQKEIATGGIPQSMYAPIDPNAKPPSASDDKDKKKKDDLQIQVFNAWKNAGLSAQQAMLLTAEVGRENAYNAKVLFGYHKDANNGKLNVGMLSWQGSRATDLSKYLAAAGVLKNGKIEKSQESLNAMAQFAVKEMMSNPAYAKTKTVFLANKEIDTNTGFNVLGRDYIRWDMDGRKINANTHKARRNNYYTQIQAKVGDKDLVSNFMEQTKAHDDYVNSIATGEAKIRAELAKTIESLPKKGFSGQALEDEKKRLTEEARFDIDLFRETNRQKLDELMGVHKTKKQQILDEATLQSLTIAADESKSREQRKTELEALDVGTKEKIRLNDIANKYELGKIWAFRKTSSELIADEWDERIQAAMDGNSELKDEYIASYKEQKQLALDIDKLTQQQQLLDLQKFNMADIAYFEQTLKIKKELIAKSNATPEMQNAQNAAADYETYNSIYDTRKSANDGYMSTYFDLYGQKDKYEAYKGADDKRISQNDAVQKALDAGIIQHEEYYQTLKDIDAQYVANKQAILVGGYQSIFGTMTSLMKAFGGEQSRAYRVLASIEKGYALYKAFLNNKTAILDAYATTPGAWYTKAAAAAKVAIDTGVMTAAIQAISPRGFSSGGYTGNYGVNDVAGVVHGKEYVLNAAATKRIGVDNLNAMNKGASIGNNNVSVNVAVNADGSSDVQSNAQMGKQMGDAIKAAVLQTIVQEKRQGGLLSR